jgi:hypothetical protein
MGRNELDRVLSTLALSASMSLAAGVCSQAQQANMSFFMTSVCVPFSSSRRRPGSMFGMGTGLRRCDKIFATIRNGSTVSSVNRLNGLSISAGAAGMNVWRLVVRGNRRRKLVSEGL